ncbi:hypothetical protein PF010_g17290 [Phytophthora fragariae]|nr:hypothetical protein PF003_g22504 [Phytophthora fragariae]KAE8893195.1 hypothetical protein PF003_g22505 [Phytophthora fragariae]KAE8934797.1 hypothetical protein PF009_g15228 [Phytophthora fragariae]KAE8994452.1 hypothetical protein PF011_g16729 [Phytophthora fragariae]KAE9093939.1 hypothetical protein PF010_g17290 [Phytophthora fragariae]
MALLAVAALGATGVRIDENPISHPSDDANHLVTSEPVSDERTWVPFRALRSMDSPKQGPHDDGKHPPHDSHYDSKKDDKQARRALGQAPVTSTTSTSTTEATPAPTKTGGANSRATPAPTRTSTPKATPAATTTKATASAHKGASPANKKPKAGVAPPTKQGKTGKTGKTGVSTTSNAAQQKSRNLGGDEAKQQLPHDHHHDAKQNSKNGLKHQ